MKSFYGLKLTNGLVHSREVDQSFHISAATLDIQAPSSDIVSVVFNDGSQDFVLCNLSKTNNVLQVPLDLQFGEGEKVSFKIRGNSGVVYLTGYYAILDDDDGLMYSLINDEAEKAESDVDLDEPEEATHLVDRKGKKKRKLSDSDSKPAQVDQKKARVVHSDKQVSKLQKEALKEKSLNGLAKSNGKENKNKPAKTEQIASDIRLTAADLFSKELADSDDENDDDFEADSEVEEEEEDDDDEEGEDEEMEDDDEEGEDEDDDNEDEEGEEEEDEEDEDDEEVFPKLAKKQKMGAKMEVDSQSSSAKNKKDKQKKQNGAHVESKKNNEQNKSENAKFQKKMKNKEFGTPISTPTTPKPQTPKLIKAGGLVCQDLVIGSGPDVKRGKIVSVYYEGRLKNGKVFDKQLSGKPFKFALGKNEVIKAWDIGLEGMKVGGKRRLTAPSNLAYGKGGAPPDIPPNSTLVFDVEIKAIN